MNIFEKILQFLKGKEVDKLSDAEKAELQKMLEPEAPAKNDPPQAASESPLNSKLLAEIKTLTEPILKKLADQEAISKRLQDERDQQAKTLLEQKIDEEIKKAVDAGKLGAKDDASKAKWKDSFLKDYQTAEFALSQIPAKIGNPADKKTEQDTPASSDKPQTRAELVSAAKSAFKTNRGE
jgi:molecular chaperone GrpE (heat shock protein)